MKKMIFVFNPRSGKEAIKNQLSDILGIFCGAGYLPSVYVTQEPGDAAKIAEEYGKDVELFVCSGGDGTLNSVISGIMRLEKPTASISENLGMSGILFISPHLALSRKCRTARPRTSRTFLGIRHISWSPSRHWEISNPTGCI